MSTLSGKKQKKSVKEYIFFTFPFTFAKKYDIIKSVEINSKAWMLF